MNALAKATGIEQFCKDFRENIHMEPEIAAKEFETQRKIIAELEKNNIPYQKVGSTSTVATIDSGKPGKILGFRADIDALAMKEESDVPFISKTMGVAHACGHDVHTAMLLSACILLNKEKDNFAGKIKCIFQEGEESLLGAKKVIESGAVDDVEMFFALHCMPLFDTGKVSISPGYQLTGSDTVKIDWIGVSGHGSTPHLAKDSIHAAAVFVADLQSVVTKNISPQDTVVATVCQFHGGTTFNIISKYTSLEMTLRFYDDKVRSTMHEQIKKHATHIAEMYGVEAQVEIIEGVKSTFNAPEVVKCVKESFNKFGTEEQMIDYPPIMSSEDFSFYTTIAPSAMAWLGTGNAEKGCIYYPHHEKFKVDEDSFKYGIAWFYQTAMDYLN